VIEPPRRAPVTDLSPGLPTELPEHYIPLQDVIVTVRPGGVNVRTEPDINSHRAGNLLEGERHRALGLIFRDYTWLHIPWQRDDQPDQSAWIAGDYTDFPRSKAYDQVSYAWYDADPVLEFRRTLLKDMLRLRSTAPEKIAQVDHLEGEALYKLEDTLTRQTMLPQYARFWQMQEFLGLPDPFEHLPVQVLPPHLIDEIEFSGFGPNTFAFENWQVFYETTRGLHSGVDLIVPEGSPLIAVCDGVVVDFRFLRNRAERSLAIRAYLPEQYRTPDGARVLSNVVVAYGHLTGDPTSELVFVGDEVYAGEIIGTSGWPLYTRNDGSLGIQYNNPHLHLEVHLVTNGTAKFGSRHPFNPLLFWSPRMIALQARLATHRNQAPYPAGGHPYGRLGFFSLGTFAYDPPTPIVWEYEPNRQAVWPEGVYNLEEMIRWLQTFDPYPTDGSSLV